TPGVRAPLALAAAKPAPPNNRIRRRRPAERFAPRPIDAAAIEPGLRVGQIVPVKSAAEQLKPGDRHVDAAVLVFRTGLQDEDLVSLVGAEALGDNRAG